jgi:hypothetical protein
MALSATFSTGLRETTMMRFRTVLTTLVLQQSLWIAAVPAQTTEQATDAAPAAAKPEAKPQSPVDPTGTWKWQYDFGETPMDAKLKLNWDGKKLTGKYTARDVTTDVSDGKLEKDELTFITVREFNGNEFEIEFEGKVKEDEIVGLVMLDFGQAQEFDWNAKRAVEIDDVLGVWDLRLDTPNGVVEPRLTITKDDDNKLKGTYSSVFGDREPNGLTLKDNELSWEIASGDDDEFDFQVLYKGKPRGNRIEGATEFDFGGNTGTMKFTGKRTPPKEKDDEARPAAATATPANQPDAAQPATETTEPESAGAAESSR